MFRRCVDKQVDILLMDWKIDRQKVRYTDYIDGQRYGQVDGWIYKYIYNTYSYIFRQIDIQDGGWIDVQVDIQLQIDG